jgi:hypothetical protein
MLRSLLMFCCLTMIGYAQIECDVTVNLEQVSSAKDKLQNFEREIESYINSQKWSSEDLGGEKIKCTMNIFFTAADGNSFKAQAFIGSSRPVFVGKNPSAKKTRWCGPSTINGILRTRKDSRSIGMRLNMTR